MEPTLFIDFPGGGIRTFEITLHDIVSPAQNLAIGCNDDLHTTYRPAYRPQFMISPSQKIHCDHRRSEERRVGTECVSVDIGGRRIINKKNNALNVRPQRNGQK